MLETDADRLASIKGLGGQLVRAESGECWAIFDAAGVQLQFDDTYINSTTPRLTLRSSDVDLLGIGERAQTVTVDDIDYLVREKQDGDAPGWAVLILDKP